MSYRMNPDDAPKIAITAQRDFKTRIAVWVKYHYTLWSRTINLRLTLPACIWGWADRYIEDWHIKNG